VARRMSGENGSSGRPNEIRRQFRRLCQANRRCEEIMSQVPGRGDDRHEDLPGPLARLLGRCDCGTIYNVMRACLTRLVSEAILPPSAADSPPPGRPAGGRPT
jgi:hypothetical protein